MCEWGTDVLLPVIVPANLAHNGKTHPDVKGVDACIAPLVNALNAHGILTAKSFCGHGKAPGWILLHDGRTIIIHAPREEAPL